MPIVALNASTCSNKYNPAPEQYIQPKQQMNINTKALFTITALLANHLHPASLDNIN